METRVQLERFWNTAVWSNDRNAKILRYPQQNRDRIKQDVTVCLKKINKVEYICHSEKKSKSFDAYRESLGGEKGKTRMIEKKTWSETAVAI